MWFDKNKVGQDLPIVVGKQFLRNVYAPVFGYVNNDMGLTPTGSNYVTLYSYTAKKWYDE